MKRAVYKYRLKWSLFILAFFIVFSNAVLKGQDLTDSTAAHLTWNTEKISDGIYWKSYRGNQLYDSRQSINLVEVVLDSADVAFKLAFIQDSMLTTSVFAEENEALAAVNGSFFREDTGGPTAFLKIDGDVIFEGSPNRNPYNETGGLGWSDNKPVQILKKPEENWRSADFQNILSSGPLLVYNSEIQSFNNDPFHQNRHPRTVAAITNDNRLYLVTIDGRSFQAFGMTIPELAHFLKELGAEYALNLDGGGSTTMWIKNMAENGIVNYPSDNLEFDHEGERKVSNALLVIPSAEF